MDIVRYSKLCDGVVEYINHYPFGDSRKNVEAINDIVGFVERQIRGRRVNRNEYISFLIPRVKSSMGIWARGCVDEDELVAELSLLMDDIPAQQSNNESIRVSQQRISINDFVDEERLEQAHKVTLKGRYGLRDVLDILFPLPTENYPSFIVFDNEFKGLISRTDYYKVLKERKQPPKEHTKFR